MTTTENTMFGITREDVLNLTAQKLADQYGDFDAISSATQKLIHERVEKAFSSKLTKRIDDFLAAEMEKIVGQEIVAVNIWGEREGAPTSIRATLAKRAQDFWNVKVNSEGREECYGGTERYKRLMHEVMKDTFAAAVKENAEVIVGAFKAALKADATKLVTEHIDKLINVKAR